MHIVIFGIQGSGKGTQSKLLVEKFGFLHIAPGDIFRKEIGEGTELGAQLDAYVSKGLLVPDEVTLRVIRAYMEKGKSSGTILDGFPRNQAQLEGMEAMMHESGITVDAAISITISKEEALQRLLGRRLCSHCSSIYNVHTVNKDPNSIPESCRNTLIIRADENAEAIEKRLAIYEEMTFPLLDYYKQSGKLISIDGMQDIYAIHEEIIQQLHLGS